MIFLATLQTQPKSFPIFLRTFLKVFLMLSQISLLYTLLKRLHMGGITKEDDAWKEVGRRD